MESNELTRVDSLSPAINYLVVQRGPARLEVFTVEQVETMARVAQSGAWRDPSQKTPENTPFLRAGH